MDTDRLERRIRQLETTVAQLKLNLQQLGDKLVELNRVFDHDKEESRGNSDGR